MPATESGDVIEWQFPDTAWTGFVDVDAPNGLVQDMRSSISARLWQSASEHFCGVGMEFGVDMTSLRKLYQQFESLPKGNRMAEVLSMVVTGGSWPRGRRVDAAGAKALGLSRFRATPPAAR